MSTFLVIVVATSAGVLGVGVILWFSMKMTDRKETSSSADWPSSGSDAAGGYQAPGYPCGADGGGCD